MILDGFDRLLDDEIQAIIAAAEADSHRPGPSDLPVYDVLRYHLGYLDASFQAARSDGGKRVRPRLCALCCAASGADPARAIHAAAAIELVHNFSLIHDDIQDRASLRRHRETVWALWGTAQAINAGDAMFALAYLALSRSRLAAIEPSAILELSTRLHQTTLRIVEGQVLDLGFESRADVSPDEYLRMISGKTAAICRYACWAGAHIADASGDTIDLLADFGFAVGIGFQLRDDILGIWGTTGETGKATADDIRRRKKSYPLLLLQQRADDDDRQLLLQIFAQPEVPAPGIEAVLAMLRVYDVRAEAEQEATAWHDRAVGLLETAVPLGPARSQLDELIRSLELRTG